MSAWTCAAVAGDGALGEAHGEEADEETGGGVGGPVDAEPDPAGGDGDGRAPGDDGDDPRQPGRRLYSATTIGTRPQAMATAYGCPLGNAGPRPRTMRSPIGRSRPISSLRTNSDSGLATARMTIATASRGQRRQAAMAMIALVTTMTGVEPIDDTRSATVFQNGDLASITARLIGPSHGKASTAAPMASIAKQTAAAASSHPPPVVATGSVTGRWRWTVFTRLCSRCSFAGPDVGHVADHPIQCDVLEASFQPLAAVFAECRRDGHAPRVVALPQLPERARRWWRRRRSPRTPP